MGVCGDMLEVIVNALNSPSATSTAASNAQESQNGKSCEPYYFCTF